MSGRYCRRRWQLADKVFGNARQRVIYRVWEDLVELSGVERAIQIIR